MRPDTSNKYMNITNGVLVTGDIILNTLKNVAQIPQQALNSWEQNGEATIYVYINNEIKLRSITTGILYNDMIEVKKGLKDTDLVVQKIGSDFCDRLRVSLKSE